MYAGNHYRFHLYAADERAISGGFHLRAGSCLEKFQRGQQHMAELRVSDRPQRGRILYPSGYGGGSLQGGECAYCQQHCAVRVCFYLSAVRIFGGRRTGYRILGSERNDGSPGSGLCGSGIQHLAYESWHEDQASRQCANLVVGAAVFAVKLLLGSFGFTLGSLINGIFAPLFSASDSLIAVLIYCILVRILWFFGLHGNNIAGSVVNVVLTANLVENAEAILSGGKATHIFNSAFQNWTTTGILAIVIAAMIVAKSQQLKAISKISLVPALFNIGEPLTFGLPLVLNFDIFIPYLIVFALNGAVPYLACQMGFMNIPYLSIPFTVPAFIKVFLMSMDARAVLVYLVNMALSVLVMIPALRRYDRKLLAEELKSQE